MTQRVTITTLRAVCNTLNRRAGFPDGTKLWQRIGDKNVATIGMYYIDGAYGGWALHKIHNEGGGISDPFRNGHMSARELYNLMWAYMEGLADAEKTVSTCT